MIAVLLASLSFSLTSCGDDDDDEGPDNGGGSSLFINGAKAKFYSFPPSYEFSKRSYGIQCVFMADLSYDDTDYALEINVDATSDTSDEAYNRLSNLNWVKVGADLAPEGYTTPDFYFSRGIVAGAYGEQPEYVSGNIVVKSKGKDNIVLTFNNYKCIMDEEEYTFKGDVTFIKQK